jgi:hypothetical protein
MATRQDPANGRRRATGASARAERVDDGVPDDLYPALRLVFAPLHKAAFGTATGVAGALLLASLTLYALLSERARAFPLQLLDQYFTGYTVSWGGLIVGTVWGFAVGFVAGWFIAFCRNLAMAIVAFSYRARAELDETRDFLDHI